MVINGCKASTAAVERRQLLQIGVHHSIHQHHAACVWPLQWSEITHRHAHDGLLEICGVANSQVAAHTKQTADHAAMCQIADSCRLNRQQLCANVEVCASAASGERLDWLAVANGVCNEMKLLGCFLSFAALDRGPTFLFFCAQGFKQALFFFLPIEILSVQFPPASRVHLGRFVC